jgi:3-oxoacyl-[acyl-carrier protein] reductase
VRALVALGSNLGDRARTLDSALDALGQAPGVRVVRVSSYHETLPVGGPPGQPNYLNAVVELETDLSPEALLALLQQIEQAHGRERPMPNAARTLDLDLLLYGDLVRIAPDPIIPHPRMHLREFVLAPLAEIAPEVVHPVLHRSIRELYADWLGRRELTGLRVLVTGSTSGIGRAIALELAQAGADVVVHGRRSRPAAEAVAQECQRHSVRAGVCMSDLSQLPECERLTREAWDMYAGLDVVVLNAGADTLTGEARHWEFSRKLHELLAVDVVSTIHLARAFGQSMQTQGYGSIITMGWDQAETGMEGDSGQLFAATKGAVMAFTRSLAKTLAPAVRVNCVAPGWIKTSWGESAPPVWQERVLRETPLRRWGTPEDVAGAVRWLASPASAFVTGQIVRVNGGAV